MYHAVMVTSIHIKQDAWSALTRASLGVHGSRFLLQLEIGLKILYM